MKRLAIFSILVFISLIPLITSCKQKKMNEKMRTALFDDNWRFIKENPSGAENPAFDDSKWRTIDLPHDWSIEDLPGQTGDSVIGPFSRAASGKMSTGYTVGGTAWYRKSFVIDKADKEKIAFLQFDGIYMNSDVWINGKHVGNHPYGYTSFYYDITPYLNPAGQPNVVAVQVKNEGRNARWYSGSGIYRHTWLTLVNLVHIGVWGIYVTTPVVTDKSAEVDITTTLVNSGREDVSATLQVQLLDSTGKIVGTTNCNSDVAPDQSTDVKQTITLEDPSLWSIEKPSIYKALVTVLVNNKEVEKVITTFGIRSIKFDAATGFALNGESMELKGGCFHHDNGPLGSAAIDRAEERKIELLKNAGFNAIRCSHNPPSPYLLDVCDRLGMLVIDEFVDMWEKPKVSPDDYSKYFKSNWEQDLSSIVIRDRNHPSVIMWSIGNEIPEAADTSGLRIAKSLAAEVRRLDPTRAVTEAMVDFMAFTTGKSGWDKQAPHMDVLDVVGYNYAYERYQEDHKKYPSRIMFASEFMPPRSLQNWQTVEDLPYVIGNFSWTAMDYLGEAGVGLPRLIYIETVGTGTQSNPMAQISQFFNPDSWPVFNNFQGDIDLIGNPKTPYYYQHVVWRQNKVEMFVHTPIPSGKKEIVSPWGFPDEMKSWSWPGHEGEKMLVHIYTRSKLVKLELNGKTIGEAIVDDGKSITATFEVPYKPGTLTAHCFDSGVETASETIKTVGKPAAIRLKADRSTIKADRNDLSYIMVEITDAEGNVVPYANDVLVNFEVSGNGEIAGVGSGNPTDMSSFQQPQKKTWQGRCLAIIRPKGEAGKITLKAKAEGLTESSIEITAK
jgi:beta-galactosidase